MAQSDPKRLGVSVDIKPHAYDPVANPELFEGVLARRVVAFLIDFLILSIPVVFVSMFIFVVGIVTFGLGFLIYGLLPARHAGGNRRHQQYGALRRACRRHAAPGLMYGHFMSSGFPSPLTSRTLRATVSPSRPRLT